MNKPWDPHFPRRQFFCKRDRCILRPEFGSEYCFTHRLNRRIAIASVVLALALMGALILTGCDGPRKPVVFDDPDCRSACTPGAICPQVCMENR